MILKYSFFSKASDSDSLIPAYNKKKKMSRNFLNIVLICIFTSFIVCAHVYKDYTSNAVLLSSVYDAMKNNLQKNIRNNLNRDDVLRDYRNKRNINERVEYYDTHPSDLNAE